MQPRLTTCSAIGCQATIREPLLMCLDHWRQVPAALRRQVWGAYRRLGHDHDAPEAHRSAVQAAIDAVHHKQARKQGRRDAGTQPLF